MRYLDRAGLSYKVTDALIHALDLTYDEELTDPAVLKAGDVVVTGPLLAHRWAYLPRSIDIEVVPDGVEVNRKDPLKHAIDALGLPASYKTKAPSEKAKYYNEYQEAVAWSNKRGISIWMGEAAFPYEVVDDPYRAQEVVRALHGQLYAVDYETTGNPNHIITHIALANKTMSWLIGGPALAAGLAELAVLFKDPESTGVAHSAIYEYKTTALNSMRSLDPTDMNPLHCTRVLNYIVDNQPGTNRLKDLTKKKLKRDVITFEEVVPEGTDIRDVPLDFVARYAAAGDARNTYDLFTMLRQEAFADGLWHVYNDIERPLIPVLAEMELAGFPIDTEVLDQLAREYIVRRARIVEALHHFGLKGEVNGDAVAEWFYDELQLPVLKFTPSGKRGSVDADTLELLAERTDSPQVKLYQAYQEATGLVTKFLLPTMRAQTNWLYPSIQQTSTQTGRLSYTNPNLQQMPKEIRKMFIGPPGQGVVSFDFSAQEPRTLAVLTGDTKLIEIFNDDSKDVYLELGREFGMSPAEAKAKRQGLKVTFLAALYGQNTEYARQFVANHPQFAEWRRKLLDDLRRNGSVRSLEGRRRVFPRWMSHDPLSQQSMERMAVNMPVQGTAADETKAVMPPLYRFLKKQGVQMRLAVHDELIMTMTEETYNDLKPEIIRIMTTTYDKVRLKVDGGYGDSWYTAKG